MNLCKFLKNKIIHSVTKLKFVFIYAHPLFFYYHFNLLININFKTTKGIYNNIFIICLLLWLLISKSEKLYKYSRYIFELHLFVKFHIWRRGFDWLFCPFLLFKIIFNYEIQDWNLRIFANIKHFTIDQKIIKKLFKINNI